MLCRSMFVEELYEALNTFHYGWYLTNNLLYREAGVEDAPPFLPKCTLRRKHIKLAGQWTNDIIHHRMLR